MEHWVAVCSVLNVGTALPISASLQDLSRLGNKSCDLHLPDTLWYTHKHWKKQRNILRLNPSKTQLRNSEHPWGSEDTGFQKDGFGELVAYGLGIQNVVALGVKASGGFQYFLSQSLL